MELEVTPLRIYFRLKNNSYLYQRQFNSDPRHHIWGRGHVNFDWFSLDVSDSLMATA